MSPARAQSQEEIIRYLLLVMKHSEFKPDYHQVAQEANISSANNAQKRFKKYVELGGFSLSGGTVVGQYGSDAAPTTPTTPKAGNKAAAGGPTPTKKRKMKEATPHGEDAEDDGVKREGDLNQKE